MLIVFGGLPGTGKTTISRAVAAELPAIYLRIDVIEQAIRNAGVLSGEVGACGYDVALAIAGCNLSHGRIVVADCVNPVAASREAWRALAAAKERRLIEIEVVCSDIDEHRRRVETREPDIAGHRIPTWQDVTNRTYDPWDKAPLVLDTTHLSPAQAVELVINSLR